MQCREEGSVTSSHSLMRTSAGAERRPEQTVVSHTSGINITPLSIPAKVWFHVWEGDCIL